MPGRIAILSGPRGSGKTTLCGRLLELARQRGSAGLTTGGQLGLDCAGVISPARFERTRFEGGHKVGIDLLDVRSGERRPLAEAIRTPGLVQGNTPRTDPRRPEDGEQGGDLPRQAKAVHSNKALRTQAYRFHAGTLAWGSAVLEAASPCDLLFVDELGLLELERGQGWVNALDVLRAGRFRLAVVVVRPELVGAFRGAMPGVLLEVFSLPAPPGVDMAEVILALLSR